VRVTNMYSGERDKWVKTMPNPRRMWAAIECVQGPGEGDQKTYMDVLRRRPCPRLGQRIVSHPHCACGAALPHGTKPAKPDPRHPGWDIALRTVFAVFFPLLSGFIHELRSQHRPEAGPLPSGAPTSPFK
jgi:hypothetical protein